MVNNLPAMQETQVRSLDREDPLEEEIATHSSILAGESHGQRSLAGYSPWSHKELDDTEQLTLSLFFFHKQDTQWCLRLFLALRLCDLLISL